MSANPEIDDFSATQTDVPASDGNGEDPLKRRTNFSWKSFGGDGFLVSVLIHAALIVFALFYVVAQVRTDVEPEPYFEAGTGGSNNGTNPSETRPLRPKPREMSTQAKITSKSATSTLTLPEMPKMSNTAGTLGGMSAGQGKGGFGGGINSGIGPGMGGRNFVSPFGVEGFSRTPTLKGALFDLKRSRDGKSVYCTIASGDAGKRKEELHKAVGILANNGFDSKKLSQRYFEAETKLNANQVYIYKDAQTKNFIRAEAATAAFAGADGNVPFEAPGWMVVYEGEITPQETGEYRFVGMGDDVMLVGIDRKPVFYAYWPGEGHGNAIREPAGAGWEPKDHCKTDGKGTGSGNSVQHHLFKGSWMKLNKGRKYKICIAFGEGAGGYAGAVLGIEKKGERDGLPADAPYSVFKLGAIHPELLDVLFVEGRYKAEGPNFMVKELKRN